jgi:membrane fusion protein (multidrug efflux system)
MIKRSAVTIFSISLFIFASCGKKNAEVPAQGMKAKAQPVKVLIIQPSELTNRITSTGTILANEEVEVRSETQGRIIHIYFIEGERVAAGKLLVKIDDSELQAELKKAELDIQLAQDDEGRNKKLLAVNGISKEEYDASLNKLLQLQAGKQLIEAQISKTSVIAPFSGVIGLRYVSEGGYVSPSNLIAVLQQTNPVKLEFSIPEKYAAGMKNGTVIEFTVEGNTKSFTGKVYAKEPKIDPATRTVKIRAISQNPNNELIPGAFAKLNIELGINLNALVVPSEAIIPGITGQSLMLMENGKATVKPVKIGIRNESSVEITEGVMAGDTVIISGLLTVREGMPVKAIVTENKSSEK